ncbi:MAG: hypothetical protein J6D31_07220 [Clostridia bacterium]|nr:hypothetical protein [Clostridia bacterium]
MEERFAYICQCLPPPLRGVISRMREGQADFLSRLAELRLRAGHHAALLYDGKNLTLPVACTQEEIKEVFSSLCGGSLYAHGESLRRGYICAHGCRVGVAGRAVWEGGQVVGLADVTSLCIRLPHTVPGAGAVAEETFFQLGCRAGLLIYSPPGGGKTTMLRELARSLSSGAQAKRVALVDARGELYDENFPAACQVDVLRHYPLAMGIEMATRTLAPEVLICDEIGSMQEAEAILSVQGCGVPLIASAHAAALGELLARPPIALLAKNGVFGAYIGIARRGNTFSYDVSEAQEMREVTLCYSQ